MMNPKLFIKAELVDEEKLFYKIEIDSRLFKIVESDIPMDGECVMYKSYPLKIMNKKMF